MACRNKALNGEWLSRRDEVFLLNKQRVGRKELGNESASVSNKRYSQYFRCDAEEVFPNNAKIAADDIKNFLCMLLFLMLRRLGLMHPSLKLSKAQMRRLVSEASGQMGGLVCG